MRRAKRWEDVLDILADGIEVITTLNVQHIESLNDVVAKATGIQQRETVPDWILDIADQVELVDMSPHALRRRMMHGNVYPDARKAELALRRFFTEENLTALRELALMRVANQVDEDLLTRWTKETIPDTRERVLVGVSRPDLAEALVRRGARVAQRAHGDLLVVHVAGTEDRGEPGWLAEIRDLTAKLDGEFEVIRADSAVDGRGRLRRPPARHADRRRRTAEAAMAGDPARVVRQPADPELIGHRHPRHLAPRRMTDGTDATRAADRYPARTRRVGERAPIRCDARRARPPRR